MNRINTKKRAGKLAIFLFFTFLSLTTVAQNKEKKITIQNKKISLKEAFAQIETQTGYSIAYEQSKLDIEKKHSLSLKNRHKAQRNAKFYINKCRSASCMQGGLKQASA